MVVALGCKTERHPVPSPEPSAEVTPPPSAAPPPVAAKVAFVPGDAAHGKKLVEKFECSRCHMGTGFEPARLDQNCVTCHQEIMAGTFGRNAPATERARWKKTVADYQDAPSLAAMGDRLEPEWVMAYILEPHDVRPTLVPSMPRLDVTEKQARDMATYLTANRKPAKKISPIKGDAKKGRRLLEDKSCGSCHLFTGVPDLPMKPDPKEATKETRAGTVLAPDLRYARDRYSPANMVRWLLDPKSIKPDTNMPAHSLTQADAMSLTAYLVETKLAPLPPKPIPKRLPVLDRKVKYEEVDEKVFHVTCRHCHADPDALMGDGGPGNTGGFGFPPRKLDFSTYRGTMAGYVAKDGERHSVFEKMKDGTPRLVASLLARQAEEAGKPIPDIRGMPLGLPAATPEQIQIVETWIAQGRPR